jgi:subtilisin family serine protease
MTSKEMPAWSEPFQTDRRGDLRRDERVIVGAKPRDWLAGRGEGVTVAIIDSGVDGGHPAVGGKLIRSLRVDLTLEEPAVVEDEEARDVVGHGTACAGIIHGLAPEADIISIRVLNPDNKGKGLAFAHALDWVVENRIGIANMSLSSKSEALYATFHDLVDQAYFANSLLVCSASNYPGEESYPSVFSSVFSVAAHDIPEPLTWFYNPNPPVEFGAWGVDVPIAWAEGGSIVATGNSFAAPHIAALAALVVAKHPQLAPFEVKAVLAATANEPDTR